MFKKQILLVFLLALVGQSAWAVQYARPVSTTDSAGWTANGAPTHHEAVDEVSATDSDYIDSTNGNNSTIIMSLSGVTDPGGANLNDHIIRYRCQSQGSGGPERCNIALFQGNTEIANNGNNSASRGAFTLITWAIPDASAISNYNDLNVRVTSTSLDAGESVQVSWIELEVPDATASVPPTVTSPTFANETDTTATLGGNVTDAGSAAVGDRGVEWGTSPGTYPTSVSEGGTGTGIFTVGVTGLPSSDVIYFRAWATSTVGTAQSAESNFTTFPTVTSPTVDAPSVTDTTATLGGTVTADGDVNVDSRGIEWGISPGTYTNNVPAAAGGAGTFTVPVSGLPSNTLIYFRAWATNSGGTGVSGENSFTTDPGLPTVDTPTATNISATTAELGGRVASDGGGTVTDRGTVWGTNPNPTGNAVSEGGGGTGTFSHLRTGLPTGTLVYFRAYATNAAGTAYSADATFTPADLPIVTTPTVDSGSITTNSALLGGNVTSDGGAALTARGTVWNTTGTPVVENALAEGGTTTGTFTQTRSGLPPDTDIFFRAYATNATHIGYSPQGQFRTEAAAETQASNLTFDKKAGRSVRLTWTRGSREGVIVVMRLTSSPAGLVGPTEGVDYTPDPDLSGAPGPDAMTGTDNYVVYKGDGTSVLVTGLTYTTSYSVAVYEYSGTGATSSYLAGPAQATDSTTNYDVHNYDYRANCDDCHNHGSFGARGAELKAICSGCHNPLGVASAKLEFGFEDTWNTTGATTTGHPTPTKNPGIDVVDCGMCHELHNHTPTSTNTTYSTHSVTLAEQNNLAFLRANVDKYVPGAATPAYLHTDTPRRVDPHPDAPQTADNPDRAVEGGNDATARGYCQVCHTMTNYHRSSNTAGAEQCHDGASNTSCGPAEVHCGSCHEHSNDFAGAGGSCTGCHSSPQGSLPRPIITTQFDRNSKHIPGGSAVVAPEDCEVCHDQTGHPGDQIVGLVDADDAGTTYEQPTAGASTLATGEGAAFEQACLSCHDSNGASRLPATGDQTPLSPFTGSGAPPAIDETVWNNASHKVMTCVGDGSNGCHGSGHGSHQNSLLAPADVSPASSMADFCLNCHDGDGPSSINIDAQFNTGTNYQTTAEDGAAVNQRHDITVADQTYSGGSVTCKDCHAPHANNNTNPVFELDTGQALPTYSPAGRYTEDGHDFYYDSGGATPTDENPTNPLGGTGSVPEPDYIQFCLACHDGTPPSANVTMSTSLTNMAAAWNNDQHGNAAGGTGTQIGKGNLKPPWNTQATYEAGEDPPNTYAALNCTTCHGAHGSGNIFNLRESITVAGVQMSTGCPGGDAWCAGSEFAGIVGTSYTLPLEGGTQNDHKWGAWCTFCHNMRAHRGVTETTGCTSAHKHGANSF